MCSTTAVVSGLGCTRAVGSLSHDDNIVTIDQTYILVGYTVPCSGTVVAWEFCYQINLETSVTFYPGIWSITGTSGNNTDYELIQSNSVTYSNVDSCQRFNLSTTDQFNVPAESVVGLYSSTKAPLLHTNMDSSITTYQFRGNQRSINNAGNNNDVNYNIAIRVHLGKTV